MTSKVGVAIVGLRKVCLTAIGFSIVTLMGCGTSPGRTDSAQDAPGGSGATKTLQGVEGLSIRFYAGMRNDATNLVQRDMQRIAGFELNSLSQDFRDVFGGDGSQSVIDFIDARVKVIVPHEFKFERYLVASTAIAAPEHAPVPDRQADSDGDPELEADDAVAFVTFNGTGVLAASNASVVAQNLGTSLWLSTFANPLIKDAKLVVNDIVIPLDSPRIGLVQLGEFYAGNYGSSRFSESTRTSVWVHEARHSDCTGGLSAAQKAVLAGPNPEAKIGNWKCGHTHALCPIGHDYQNLAACEDQDWGAYTVGAVYSSEIAASCTNCSPAQIEQAKIEALDSWGRVLNADDIRSGAAGRPDMSSAY